MMKVIAALAVGLAACAVGIDAAFSSAIELYSTPLYADSSLKAYYRFEGNSNDAKGNHNGTDTGIDYATAYGKFGQGAGFSGGTDVIRLPDNDPDLMPTGIFSTGFWIRTSYAGEQVPLKYGDYNTASLRTTGWDWYMASSIRFLCAVGGGTTKGVNYEYLYSSMNINDGVWHFVVGVYDGSYIRLYIDGVEDGHVAWSSGLAYDINAYGAIGRSYSTTDGYYYTFTGSIDDIFIFNGKALTATDVSNLYNGTFFTPTPTVTPTAVATPEPTDTPGPPGTPAPSRYTLTDIYDYLNSGTAASVAGHALDPPAQAVPGDTRFRTLNQIYDDIKAKFDRCPATAADVTSGVAFFCTQPGNWGVQTGTHPLTWYETYGQAGQDKVVQIGGLYVAKWTNNEGTANNAAMMWDNAVSWATGLNWLGKTAGWRLATGNVGGELSSLCSAKSLLGAYYPDHYWSSTYYSVNSAWGVYFDSCGLSDGWNRTIGSHVRAVRAAE